MADLYQLAQTASVALAGQSEDDLYLELGKRLKEIPRNPPTAADYTPPQPIEIETLGFSLDDLREFGKKCFNRISRQAFELVCGSDPDVAKDRQGLLTALGLGDRSLAVAALAALLVSHVGLAALIAAPVAAIAMRLFFDPVYTQLCATWKSHLPPAP